MIAVDARDFERLAVGSKEYGSALRKMLRKELTAAAKVGVTAVKGKIRSAPVKGDVPYRQAGGLRRDIANATRSNVAITAARGVSVRIRIAKTGALSANNRWRVAQLMNRGDFRHPLFGEWVEGLPSQRGYPGYFDDTLKALAPEMMIAANMATLSAAKLTLPNVI